MLDINSPTFLSDIKARTAANQQKSLDTILSKIDAAVEAGENGVQVDSISAFAEAALNAVGIRVNSLMAVQNMGIKISW
jgi:uncharacterized pyridoxal phosphate-containing UPF0001 family protein